MSENKLRGASVLLHAAPDGGGSPTALLEFRLAAVHGTDAALVSSSRLSALWLLLSELMVSGDNLVCADQICGESHAFLDVTCPRLGHDVRWVSSPWDLACWEEQIDERTQLLLVECPSDPNMFVPDLEPLAALAADHCIPLVVDTSVSTALACPATRWGGQFVLTSLSGDLCGGACSGGAVMGGGQQIADLRRAAVRAPGWPLPEAEAAAALLGLETLADRLRTKLDSCRAVRSYLLERRAEGDVTFVDHPSLRKHPQYKLARRYFTGSAGALISFGLRGKGAPERFMAALRMIAPATAVGGNRTTVCHPFSSTHAGLSDEQKAAAVIRPEVLRLCVGNEDPADILEDLERGFGAL